MSPAQSLDLIPPTPPSGLTAAAPTCGQIDLNWTTASDEPGGSGLKGYTIHRAENGYVSHSITIGAARTSFSDTNEVKSGATVTYQVLAVDYAGNQSVAATAPAVTTPACPVAAGTAIIDEAHFAPLGKAIATYGSRSAVLYVKQNPASLTWETWVHVNDADTGQTSRLMLHASPGYNEIETDYVLTSATELWTFSHQATLGGKVFARQYRLNGTPPTSATLLSTKALGDNTSKAKSLLRLKSGALLFAWSQEGWGYSSYDLTAGFAYRSPNGQWTVKSPVTIPNTSGGTIVMSSWTMAQHPADASVWVFLKRDSFHEISAARLTEAGNGILIDWIKSDYINVATDGDNGPEGEYPFLAAVADPTRNAILLAYQGYRDRRVFIDPLYGNGNSIFLKDAPAIIAEVQANGSKTFIPFPQFIERCAQFGMSVLADGTIWLTYQPINAQSLTWNEVYASKYQNEAWSAPALAGYNYRSYNVASGARDPGLLISRLDLPQVAFLTPDRKVHAVALSDAPPPAPADTTPPVAAIVDPLAGATVTGVTAVAASASDNVGVTRVDFLVDGVVAASRTAAPYTFAWDTSQAVPGSHSLQAVAHDAAGGAGTSAAVVVTVASGAADTEAPSVAVASPQNGSTVPRNSSVTVSAIASDNAGVARVDLYVGSSLIGSSTAAPYSARWKTPAKPNSVYTIKAVAYDRAGNSATATSTVTAK